MPAPRWWRAAHRGARIHRNPEDRNHIRRCFSLIAGTRERRMIRHGILDTEFAEPAIGEAHLYFTTGQNLPGTENGLVASTTNIMSAANSVVPLLKTSIVVPAGCPFMACPASTFITPCGVR